ncbi:hypothetical protein FRC04_008292 [Tulasnella sp. 424]|nr:hypothetical protein FRC04_008292 [Tulasnella sp. 424]
MPKRPCPGEKVKCFCCGRLVSRRTVQNHARLLIVRGAERSEPPQPHPHLEEDVDTAVWIEDGDDEQDEALIAMSPSKDSGWDIAVSMPPLHLSSKEAAVEYDDYDVGFDLEVARERFLQEDRTEDLEAEEARLLARLNAIRSQPPTVTSPSAPPPTTTSMPASKAASTSSSPPSAAHHDSESSSKKPALILKVEARSNLAAYLEGSVQMNKSKYNFFLRAVRAACGIVRPNDTWKSLSPKTKNEIIRAITDDQDNKPLLPYLRNRFENDWVIETAIIRHLQERKRSNKRALESLASAMSTRQSIDLPPDSLFPATLEQTLSLGLSTKSEAGSGETNDMAAIPASGITPSIPLDALDLAQAAKQPPRMADVNIDASTSDQTITESLLPKRPSKKGSVGKRKASGTIDVVTDENEAEGTPFSAPVPPPKKSRTKKATLALAARSRLKRSAKAK